MMNNSSDQKSTNTPQYLQQWLVEYESLHIIPIDLDKLDATKQFVQKVVASEAHHVKAFLSLLLHKLDQDPTSVSESSKYYNFVIVTCLRIIKEIRAPEYFPFLIDLFNHSKSKLFIEDICDVFISIKSPDIIPFFKTQLSNKNYQYNCALSLARLGDQAGMDTLLQSLNDSIIEERVNLDILHALIQLKNLHVWEIVHWYLKQDLAEKEYYRVFTSIKSSNQPGVISSLILCYQHYVHLPEELLSELNEFQIERGYVLTQAFVKAKTQKERVLNDIIARLEFFNHQPEARAFLATLPSSEPSYTQVFLNPK